MTLSDVSPLPATTPEDASKKWRGSNHSKKLFKLKEKTATGAFLLTVNAFLGDINLLPAETQTIGLGAFDPKRTHRVPLLTGPFQMVGMQSARDIIATSGHVWRGYKRSEKPSPRLNEFRQDP
jgi:hypothetical protein